MDGYHKLEVYKKAHELAVRLHRMSLTLPPFERYEEGSQIRRSSKRVSSSIVEGYAVRKYKALYLSYLYRGLGSADETQEHLRYLIETASLKDDKDSRGLLKSSEEVSRMMAGFIAGVEREHGTPRNLATDVFDGPSEDVPPESDI